MKTFSFRARVLFVSLIALLAFAGGCKKNVPAAPPPAPAPAPPPSPTVTLRASPESIQTGQSTTLSWSSTNATSLDLQPGVGSVAPEGSTSVSPATTTTYTITATGAGGSANATVSVTVTTPPPPPAPAPAPSLDELFKANVQDAFFDFDRSNIRSDAQQALQKTAEFLRSYPQVRVSIEGHCDERGSTEYNLGLGDRRAKAAKDYLASLGISANRMEGVSWGKERPFCNEHDEACWQQNRRAHFVMIH